MNDGGPLNLLVLVRARPGSQEEMPGLTFQLQTENYVAGCTCGTTPSRNFETDAGRAPKGSIPTTTQAITLCPCHDV